MRRLAVSSVICFAALGCGGRNAPEPLPPWPDVQTYKGDVDGVGVAAQMGGSWTQPSVVGAGPAVVEKTEKLLTTMPEKLKGTPAQAKADALKAAADAFLAATKKKVGPEIKLAHENLSKAASELMAVPGVTAP